MLKTDNGYVCALTVDGKTIDVWGNTEEELDKLISYYVEERQEFENEWTKQQNIKN